MNQPLNRTCARCGTAVTAEQRFCPNCGAVVDKDVVNPTAQASGPDFSQYGGGLTPPPPPEVDQYGTVRQQSQYSSGQGYPQPGEGSYKPASTDPSMVPAMVPGSQNYVTPDFAKPGKNTSGRAFRQIGCVTGLLILLALAICGGLGYGAYVFVSRAATTASHGVSGGGGTTSSGNSEATATVVVPVKTTPLNLSVKYATIGITVVDVKQGTSFDDDSSSGAPGTVRVDFKEVNATSHGVNLGYSDAARLILPDQSSIPPENYKKLEPPANGASQDNWLDFPVPTDTPVDKLSLRFGTPQEAQIDIPLVSGADLTKYQDVTVKPNSSTTYAGLKWTITAATLSWSADSRQADSGKRFVTLSVSVDNPTTTDQRGYWGDYLRLKSGSLTSTPEGDASLPLEFPVGSTGVTGNISFAVPQDSSTYTFILLADKMAAGSPEATIDLHIP